MVLDHALFGGKDQSVLIIAQTLPDAYKLMDEKVAYAYDRLPDAIKAMFPTTKRNDSTLEFGNGSSIVVDNSGRSGTFQFIRISEFGKINAAFPAKAREIMSGALQTADANARVYIESTAEGLGDVFHDMCQVAESRSHTDGPGQPLAASEYRFDFLPWWGEPTYRADPARVTITASDHAYFDKIEAEVDRPIDLEQRAFYETPAEAFADEISRITHGRGTCRNRD